MQALSVTCSTETASCKCRDTQRPVSHEGHIRPRTQVIKSQQQDRMSMSHATISFLLLLLLLRLMFKAALCPMKRLKFTEPGRQKITKAEFSGAQNSHNFVFQNAYFQNYAFQNVDVQNDSPPPLPRPHIIFNKKAIWIQQESKKDKTFTNNSKSHYLVDINVSHRCVDLQPLEAHRQHTFTSTLLVVCKAESIKQQNHLPRWPPFFRMHFAMITAIFLTSSHSAFCSQTQRS